MGKNIGEYINEIPQKLDSSKNISLYNLIKINCPCTIKTINQKLYGKQNKIDSESKWYTSVINYLVKKEILTTERSELGTFHNVKDSYQKYFIVPKSTLFSLENKKRHLLLYKQTAAEFLKAAELLNIEGKEYLAPAKNKKVFDFSEKTIRILKKLSLVMIIWAFIQFILLISKYGLINMIPMLLNSLLLAIGLVLYTK